MTLDYCALSIFAEVLWMIFHFLPPSDMTLDYCALSIFAEDDFSFFATIWYDSRLLCTVHLCRGWFFIFCLHLIWFSTTVHCPLCRGALDDFSFFATIWYDSRLLCTVHLCRGWFFIFCHHLIWLSTTVHCPSLQRCPHEDLNVQMQDDEEKKVKAIFLMCAQYMFIRTVSS